MQLGHRVLIIRGDSIVEELECETSMEARRKFMSLKKAGHKIFKKWGLKWRLMHVRVFKDESVKGERKGT